MAEIAEIKDSSILDAYFHRIGYSGDRSPSLETLKRLQALHTASIPFENLNPLLGQPVGLDIPSLAKKLIHDRRGGYCFEQNTLTWHVLESLGYKVTAHAARVIWLAPEGAVMPRGHMLLEVDVEDDPYLVDVGFGGVTLTSPLRIMPDVEQQTTLEPFRLLHDENHHTLQALLRGTWVPIYCFGSEPYIARDFEVFNWFASAHPQSRFVNNLIAGRPAGDRRYTLMNNEFAVHVFGGETERKRISNPEELGDILKDKFLIKLPETDGLTDLLRRLTAPR